MDTGICWRHDKMPRFEGEAIKWANNKCHKENLKEKVHAALVR